MHEQGRVSVNRVKGRVSRSVYPQVVTSASDHGPGGGVVLSELISIVGSSFLSVAVNQSGDPHVTGSVIADPLEALLPMRGGIALLVGVGYDSPTFRARVAEAASLGYAAVVVKRRDDVSFAEASRTAVEHGVALLVASEEASWGNLDALIDVAIGGSSSGPSTSNTAAGAGDLFGLADAVAASTGAAVTIEDVNRVVLAYSNLPGQVIDDARRAAILGRLVEESPASRAQYREVARATGAIAFGPSYHQLPRVVVPVRAGGRLLGSLWAIDEQGDQAEELAAALTDAAPLVAVHLLTATHRNSVERRERSERLAAELGGSGSAHIDASFTLHDRLPVALLGFGPIRSDIAGADDERLLNAVAVTAESFSKGASCAKIDSTIFVLVPRADKLDAARVRLLGHSILRAMHTSSGATFGCVFAEMIRTTTSVATTRRGIEAVIRSMSRKQHMGCVQLSTGAHAGVVQEVMETSLVAEERWIPVLRAILDHDAAHDTLYAPTLLAHIDCLGDVRRAAERLHVHHNSHRYRLRRIEEEFSVDLKDPEFWVVAWLQLQKALGPPTYPT